MDTVSGIGVLDKLAKTLRQPEPRPQPAVAPVTDDAPAAPAPPVVDP